VAVLLKGGEKKLPALVKDDGGGEGGVPNGIVLFRIREEKRNILGAKGLGRLLQKNRFW